MEIIEENKFNSSETMHGETIHLIVGCKGDCWSDDDSCPNFCDHEWGC